MGRAARQKVVMTAILRGPAWRLHLGSATVATRRRMAELCVGSVLAVLRGERPAHCVNPEVYGCRTHR